MLLLLAQETVVVNPAAPVVRPPDQANPFVWLGLVCVVIMVIFVLGLIASAIGAASKPSSCSLCGNKLKRAVYPWKIEQGGKKLKQMYLCPDCNENFEKRRSKEAVEKYFGAGGV